MMILMGAKTSPIVSCREESLDMPLTPWMSHLTASARTVAIGVGNTIYVRTVEMTDTCPSVTMAIAQMRTPNHLTVLPD